MNGKQVALFLAVVVVAGGCSSKVKNVYTTGDFDPGMIQGETFAIGGFVLGDRAELDRAALIAEGKANADPRVQTETWAPILYRQFLVAAPETRIWPWPTVRSTVDSVGLADIHRAFARGGMLPPRLVTGLAESMPGVRFLMLARIDANKVETGENTPVSLEEQKANDGRDVHAVSRGRTIKVRRTATVTLEVYSLTDGASVWSGVVERKDTELYANQVSTPQDGFQVQKNEGEPPEIKVDGSQLRAPGMDSVLSAACTALVRDLVGEEK